MQSPRKKKMGGFFASLNISHTESQCEVSSGGFWEAVIKFPWTHHSGHKAGYHQCPAESSDREGAERLWCYCSWKNKNSICRNFIGAINNSVWEQYHLVEKAEDTAAQVCQGGMFSSECCRQELVSFAVRGTWMEEEVGKEKGFGIFMEARIVMCCGGSFMNECVMDSKTKIWDTKQL